jgi:hypothetical protein
MNALKNKRHTIVSLILTTITIIFTSFYFIPYMEYNFNFLMFTVLGCWVSGGINLIYSTKIESGKLKVGIILVNLFCVYSWLFFAG